MSWQKLENRREEARAYSNLGSAYHTQRDFDKAISFHTRVLDLAQDIEDRAIEMRAYAGLGHAARCMQVGINVDKVLVWITHSVWGLFFICFVLTDINDHPQDLDRALQHHQHQLELAQELQDRAAQGRASSNLGEFMLYDYICGKNIGLVPAQLTTLCLSTVSEGWNQQDCSITCGSWSWDLGLVQFAVHIYFVFLLLRILCVLLYIILNDITTTNLKDFWGGTNI